MRRQRVVAGLVVMLVVASACGGVSVSDSTLGIEAFSSSSIPDAPPPLVSSSTVAPVSGGEASTTTVSLPEVHLAPGDGSAGIAEPVELSVYQAGVLADGVVSFVEYEASVLAHLACLEDAGVRTTGPRPVFAGTRLGWSMTPPSGMSDGEFLGIEAGCLAEYFDVVEAVYMESIRPDERMLREYAENLRVCLNDAGADLEEGLTEQEIIPIMLDLVDGAEWDVTTSELYACVDLYAMSVARSGS